MIYFKLPYWIKNQPVLMQERVCNVCRASIMLQNRMQEKNQIYISYINLKKCY